MTELAERSQVDSAPVELTRARSDRPIDIALLRPPWVTLLNSGYLMPTPPVGLGYIAAVLRDAGHRVRVIDSPGLAMDRAEEFDIEAGTVRRIGLPVAEMVEQIPVGTQLIGITNMFAHEWPVVRELAEAVRARFPDATLIVGGENATSMWTWMFEQTDAIDAAVLGEGEGAALEVAARVANGVALDGAAGVSVRESSTGKGTSTGLPVRVRKLSSIPTPAWDLFHMDGYFEHRGATGVHRGRSIPILATRGCPYKCSFCSSPNMWTTRYVVREPEDVADEIEDYVNRYQIRNVDFVDLTPMSKRSWILRLCDELESRNLEVSLQLPIGTRSEALDQEVLQRMAAAGTTNITFAPETGSEHMLEVFDKRLDLDHLLTAITEAREAGMITNIHMILGHPEERWKDRWDSWKFMMRAAFAGLHVAGTTLFYPYPGSKDFADLYDAGRITVDDAYCYDCLTRGGGGAANNWNPQLTVTQLHRVQLFMVVSFLAVSHLLHPGQIVHLFRALSGGAEEHTWLEQGLRTKWRGPMSRRRRGLTPPAAKIEVPTPAAPATTHAA